MKNKTDLHFTEQKVLNNINRYDLVEDGDLLVVGLSGGCDSVSLLNILVNISKIISFKMIAVHVNHMIRKEEASRDEIFCNDLCRDMNIGIKCIHVNIPKLAINKGKSEEETGREERYRIFNEIGKESTFAKGEYKIAVAHNRDDLAETVVFNLMRGTSVDGLKGMDFKRNNVVRPLLDISRKELLNYCREKDLSFVEDSSNNDIKYKRNEIRHNIMPVLAHGAKGDFSERIYNMSRLIKDDADFLTIIAESEYSKCLNYIENKIHINLSYFNSLHIAIRRRIIRILTANISGNLQGIESTHINDVIKLAEKNATGKYICLPGGIRFKTQYNMLSGWIEEEQPETDHNDELFLRLVIPGEAYARINELEGLVVRTNLLEAEQNNRTFGKNNPVSGRQYFDFDLTGSELVLRNRQEGDILMPYKFTGNKKLKKYFIDKKIPASKRGKIPLIARDSEVIWVSGETISQKFICNTDTKKILEIEIINILNKTQG